MRYKGEMLNGKRHGRGFLVYDDGCFYLGDWRNDLRDGIGLLQWPENRNAYEGEWKNDFKHGKGTYMWLCGSVYEGEWRDNKRTGMGRILWSNGDITEGEWLEGKMNGRGKFVSVEYGYVFEGTYLNDCRVKGEIRWSNGDRWFGDCSEDLTCRGVMTLSSSSEAVSSSSKDEEAEYIVEEPEEHEGNNDDINDEEHDEQDGPLLYDEKDKAEADEEEGLVTIEGAWESYKTMKEGRGEMKRTIRKGGIVEVTLGEWHDSKFVPTSTPVRRKLAKTKTKKR